MFETKISLAEYLKGDYKSFEQSYKIKEVEKKLEKKLEKKAEPVRKLLSVCTCVYKQQGIKYKAVLDYILREIRIDGQVVRRF